MAYLESDQITIMGDEIDTTGATTSTTYDDLDDAPGPSVTITTTDAVVVLFCGHGSGAQDSEIGYMSVAVSGASSIAAADVNCASYTAFHVLGETGVYGSPLSRYFLMTGLTPGSNTFTCKYKIGNEPASMSFDTRSLVVIAA